MTYVHSSRLTQEVSGVRSTLEEGMRTLVRDGDLHALWGRGMVMFTLNFRPDVLRNAADYLGAGEPVRSLLSGSSAPVFTASYFHRLFRERFGVKPRTCRARHSVLSGDGERHRAYGTVRATRNPSRNTLS